MSDLSCQARGWFNPLSFVFYNIPDLFMHFCGADARVGVCGLRAGLRKNRRPQHRRSAPPRLLTFLPYPLFSKTFKLRSVNFEMRVIAKRPSFFASPKHASGTTFSGAGQNAEPSDLG